MPNRLRTRTLIAGLVKIVVVIAAGGVCGLLLGVGLSRLSGNHGTASTGAASVATTTTSATTGPAKPVPAVGAAQVSVTAASAVLHPATMPAGIRRQRARLVVPVRVRNAGKAVVTPARPTLLVGAATVTTDPAADAPGTRLGPIAGGQTANVVLMFEVAGPITVQLRAQHKAELMVAGQRVAISVSVGPPV